MLSLRPQVPRFAGPHDVGSTEYEIPISELDAQIPPEPSTTTLKFRLYYPTNTPYRGQTIPWVPSPQKQWTEAFGRFLGASLGWSSVVNPLLSLMTYITIPAIPNAALKPKLSPYPLMIFSHGLAGNCNTYSSICGSLASCGMIVAAVEHRDGSCPISMIRDAQGKIAAQIDYRKYSHNPTNDVFNARNTQLRTRMWELDLLFTTLEKLNAGETLSNYALADRKATGPIFKSSMDLRPGHVSWVGHSFGACTITQFIKSVYYHHALPSLKDTPKEHDPAWRPLYTPRSQSSLLRQITPTSPVALLDVWTMPFRAPSTQWLWEKPMPCYDIPNIATSSTPAAGPTTVSIISTEFYNWTDLLNRTRFLLSANPATAVAEHAKENTPRSPKTPYLEDTASPKTPTFATPPNKHPLNDTESVNDDAADLNNDLLPPASLPFESLDATSDPISRTPSPSTISSSNEPSPASSTTSLSPSLTAKPHPPSSAANTNTNTNNNNNTTTTTSSTSPAPARLYHIPQTAHLSQSDFGPLFPTLTRLLMKAVDAPGTIELNVRAITQTMRNAGVKGIGRIDHAKLEKERRREKGWFSGGWFAGAEAEGVEHGGNGEEEEERRRQDGILEVGTEGEGEVRWRELDVPVVR